jgi:hypothetical protein
VLCPEFNAQAARDGGVAYHSVEFAVPHKTSSVQVGGADREPLIVDDPDLGVDVNRAVGKRLS